MSDYLLPCSCGQKLPVSVRQAGQAVGCSCGAQLEVPTLRGLRELERAAAPAAAGRAWGDRHRAVFVLSVFSLSAVAVVGYLVLMLPADPTGPPPAEIDSSAPLMEVFAAHEGFKQGLVATAPDLPPELREIAKRRELMIWGIKIGLALAACGLVAAAIVLVSPGKRKQ